ncbi:MAG TPA: MlaD family protein [Armatimonadota bacterium]|nr:MlaD family protein [Armatimonadota bacterium]
MTPAARTEVKVGAMVIVAVALLFGALRAIKNHGLTAGHMPVSIIFGELTESLPPGSPVKLAGVTVGRVDTMELVLPQEVTAVPAGFEDAGIVVRLRCRIQRAARLRQGYQATVRSGFPLGQTFVDIMPTRQSGPLLDPGGTLVGYVAPGMMDIAPMTAEALQEIRRAAEGIATATRSIESAATDVGTGARAIEKTMYQGSAEISRLATSVAAAANSVAEVTRGLRQFTTDGTLAADAKKGVSALAKTGEHLTRVAETLDDLLSSEGGKSRMQTVLESAERTATELERITRDVSAITGDTGNRVHLKSMLEDAAKASANLAAMSDDVRQMFGREGLKDEVARIMASVESASAKLDRVAGSLDELTSDDRLKADVRATASGLASAAGRLDRMMDEELESGVREVSRSLHQLTEDLTVTAREARRLLMDSGTSGNMEQAMRSLREAADLILDMARDVDQATGPSQSGGLGQFTRDAVGIMPDVKEALKVAKKVEHSTLDIHEDLLYSVRDRRFSTYFDVDWMGRNDTGAVLGMGDVGRTNWVRAQLSHRAGEFTGRFGLNHTTAGVGVDWRPSRRSVLSLDVYNGNAPDLDLRAVQMIGDHVRLVGGADQLGRSPNWLLGVGYRF